MEGVDRFPDDIVPLTLLTAQSDLAYATAAGVWARLPKGTAHQKLRMNAGATAPEWGSQVGARAKHSTTQSITTSGTSQAVIFDTEDYDTDAIHSVASNTSRFVVPTGMGGKWLAIATLFFAANATGARLGQFKVNGTTFIDGSVTGVPASATTAAQYVQISVVANLAAADYLEIFAYQTSGGALNLGATDTAMSFVYLGP